MSPRSLGLCEAGCLWPTTQAMPEAERCSSSATVSSLAAVPGSQWCMALGTDWHTFTAELVYSAWHENKVLLAELMYLCELATP